MSYRVLVLPDSDRMTLPVLRKIHDLVNDGATVIGPRPTRSPSLKDYPASDAELNRVADALWGAAQRAPSGEHRLGKGKVLWGVTMQQALTDVGAGPDVEAPEDGRAVWIHRRVGDADLYFVSNQDPYEADFSVAFRAGDRRPELWDPATGTMTQAARYTVKDGRVTVPLHFDPAGSVFVVFRKPAEGVDAVAELRHNGRDVSAIQIPVAAQSLIIEKAVYGVEPEQNRQSVDVTRQLRAAARGGRLRVEAGNGIAGDPALNIVKHLYLVYTLDGKRYEKTYEENELINLPGRADRVADAPPLPPAPEIALSGDRSYRLTVAQPGTYTARTASGRMLTASITDLPAPVKVEGDWQLRFPPKWGAPEMVNLDRLISWSDHPDEGVKHFSGTATYTREIEVPAALLARGRSVWLDLGTVKEVAEVTVNGKNLGILWRPPFRVNISGAAHAGRNQLEVRVTNLWPNRMIGDAALPQDKRFTYATFQPFKPTDPLLESGLLGPVSLMPAESVVVK
jgi:hypothetical protein